MPETTEPLTEAQIAEIEARHELAEAAFAPYEAVSDSLDDIPALIRDWRAMKAELQAEHSLRVMHTAMRESAEKECAELRSDLSGKQQVINELITTAKQWEDTAAELQSRVTGSERISDARVITAAADQLLVQLHCNVVNFTEAQMKAAMPLLVSALRGIK